MTALEGNLKGLDARQLTLRQSLHERRELIAEVLASLQRMGRGRRRPCWSAPTTC